jgi:hypothetical protein
MIKFVSDLRQVGGLLRVLRFPPPIKLITEITEILLKVALNTITIAQKIGMPNISKILNRNFV